MSELYMILHAVRYRDKTPLVAEKEIKILILKLLKESALEANSGTDHISKFKNKVKEL